MSKEKNNKSRKKCWWFLGAVLGILAVAAVILIQVLSTGGNQVKLYWNVDRKTAREPVDGTYHILFACDGEQIELPVADESLVRYIDTMDVMCLTLDKDGCITEAAPAENVAAFLGDRLYVQQVTQESIVFNPSITMSAEQVTVKITDALQICNTSGTGEFVGQRVAPQDLQAMDRASIFGRYAAGGKEFIATHIFINKRQETSKVYWRTSRSYDSKAKGTKRTPDENGVYTVSFYCDGETVELKFKDKALVDEVDYVSADTCHFGFAFDEEGYVADILLSNISSLTLLQCENYDIQQINEDGSYVASEMLKPTGKKGQGVIGENCAIYDLSSVAKAEGELNRRMDTLHLHDRVCIWTDTIGNPVLVYILDRRADSPAYYNPDPQYDTKAKSTTRTPNAEGYYEIQLLKAGETELQTYYVKDVKKVNTIDKSADLCVGLKVGEGNVVEAVYDLESVFGNTQFCRGYTVTNISGITITFKLGKSSKTGILAPDCKIWDVSDTGAFGAETKLRLGDTVYATKQPSSEIVNIYVISRENSGQ